jgi:apolipoprotein N-acyltransferase
VSVLRSEAPAILLAAVLLTLAYPPFTLVWPAFVCLIPAALLILEGGEAPNPWRWRLRVGFWYGTVTHAALLYWLAGALWSRGGGVVVLYAAAAVMFGSATAVMFAVVGRVMRNSPRRLVLALPAGVVVVEWLAGQVGPLGLPWHQLALTLTSAPILVQTADIAGSEGLGFLLAMTNTLLALAWWERSSWLTSLVRLEAAATLVLLMTLYGMHRLHTLPLRDGGTAAVVQPNVGIAEKWLPGRGDEIVEGTARLAQRAIDEARPDLLVWPETALPDPLESRPEWRARLIRLARSEGVTVVTGGVELIGPTSARRSNAAFAFGPGSEFGAPSTVVHRKQKLVPFVERVPGEGLDLSLDGAGGYVPGRDLATADGPLGRYGALICYELVFPSLPRALRRAGADVLVVLSNDAWLGPSAGPSQHFAHAVLRAVENRMTVVRSANSGISGIVDPLGRVVVRTDVLEEAWAAGPVLRAGVVPPAVGLGGLGGPAALMLLVGMLLTPAGRRRR